MAAIESVFDADKTTFGVQNIQNLDSIIISQEKEWESFRVVAGNLVNLKVEGVLITGWDTPCDLCADLFLRSIYQIELIIILDTDCKLVWYVFDTTRNISVSKVSLCQRHNQFKSALIWISLELSKEHAVVSTEADLALFRGHDDVKNCVDLERLGLKYLAHAVDFYDIYVTKVLAKNEELFLDSVVLVLEELDIIDALLQFLVVFLLKGVHVENEEMTVVTADPGEIVVHVAAE